VLRAGHPRRGLRRDRASIGQRRHFQAVRPGLDLVGPPGVPADLGQRMKRVRRSEHLPQAVSDEPRRGRRCPVHVLGAQARAVEHALVVLGAVRQVVTHPQATLGQQLPALSQAGVVLGGRRRQRGQRPQMLGRRGDLVTGRANPRRDGPSGPSPTP
jgi:hypothetical protein